MAKRFLTTIKLLNSTQDPATGSSGEIYFNSSTNKERIYKNGAWTNLVENALVDSGVNFPESPENGKLFYNLNSERISIYFDNIWKSLVYLGDIAEINGGQSETTSFSFEIDGGQSDTSIFDSFFDAGFSSNETQLYSEWPDGGNASSPDFTYEYNSGTSTTTEFALLIDGGSS